MAHRAHVHRLPGLRVPVGLNLKGLGELITASEWKRAAIVWAFTHEAKPGPGKKDRLNSLPISDFARTGIMSKPTIIKYRKAWAKAIADGVATDVKPGDLRAMIRTCG